MKTFWKEVCVRCDSGSEDYYCWKEYSAVLQWWEGVRVAYKKFRNEGWKLSKAKDICPYCSKENLEELKVTKEKDYGRIKSNKRKSTGRC